MRKRLNFYEKGIGALGPILEISKYLKTSTLGKDLLELVYFRVSQMNGCGFCLDMHSKELIENGESSQRLFVLNAWRETTFFSQKERAALAWAEALTTLDKGMVPDDVYEKVETYFTEEELVDLTLAVTTINTHNRFNIAFESPVGTYEVGQFG